MWKSDSYWTSGLWRCDCSGDAVVAGRRTDSEIVVLLYYVGDHGLVRAERSRTAFARRVGRGLYGVSN